VENQVHPLDHNMIVFVFHHVDFHVPTYDSFRIILVQYYTLQYVLDKFILKKNIPQNRIKYFNGFKVFSTFIIIHMIKFYSNASVIFTNVYCGSELRVSHASYFNKTAPKNGTMIVSQKIRN